MNDGPIHLPPSKVPHEQASAKVEVWVPQEHLDGLQALIQWLNGYCAAAKNGVPSIPGQMELLMHYRELRSRLLAGPKDGDE